MKRIIAALMLVIFAVFSFASCNDNKSDADSENEMSGEKLPDSACEFTFSQVGEEQKFEMSWKTEEKLQSINLKVVHNDETVSEKEIKGSDLEKGKAVVDAYYGRHKVKILYTAEGDKYGTSEKEVTLSASEYVLAPISGSMPQLYFTLNMDEITKNGELPAFVWLTRPESWNWEKLPKNVHPIPTVKLDEIMIHDNYDRMVEVTNEYIKELYSIDQNSKFDLYINDYNSYLYIKLLTANCIPESNYYVTLMSDGGASYADFNKAFNSEDKNFDADKKYAEMAEKLDALYKKAAEERDYRNDNSFPVSYDEFRQYSYVAAKEKDNVEWWILRPRAGVLCSPDEEFINRVLNDDKTDGIIEERNFSTPLKNMNDEQKAQLREFYNFNDEMFAEAEKQGKKAMMILGSWAIPEKEPDFESYVNLIKKLYGDEFVYYYKGHPNTPTSIYPDKQKQLEKLGLYDVESSINAELILFFYPDIYMCGYNSSTFLSVESPEMACAMFNMKKEDCDADYKDLIGIYLSKIEDNTKGTYHSLCKDKDHTYFLMQYNNKEKDIGIYDATDDTITKYSVRNGKFEEKK